jgi:leucyl/phenylalanyl-tRNA--protein transferase
MEAPSPAPMQALAIPWLDDHTPLPATRAALGPDTEAPGLLAAGGQLGTARLEEAYRKGVFPWYAPGQPVLWWSPDPRMVLHVADFKLKRSLRKTLQRFVRSPSCELRIDSAFGAVILACAQAPREGQAGTWIVPEMIDAYRAWHAAGAVHSFETWIDGELAGGLYGVALGRMFYGESMFSRRTDASKIALAYLSAQLDRWGFPWIDCQLETDHLLTLGATAVPRREFVVEVARLVREPAPRWMLDADLAI